MTMIDFKSNCESGGIVCAAVYLSVANMIRADAEQVIAAQLHKIHTFADQNDIVIVASYIERDGSMSEWESLLEKNYRYKVILHCGSIDSVIQDIELEAINVHAM